MAHDTFFCKYSYVGAHKFQRISTTGNNQSKRQKSLGFVAFFTDSTIGNPSFFTTSIWVWTLIESTSWAKQRKKNPLTKTKRNPFHFLPSKLPILSDLEVGERALSTLTLHHWHQLCLRLALLRRATGAQERQRGRVTMWTLRWRFEDFWDVNDF